MTTTATYTDATRTVISLDVDGTIMSVPVDPANRHYAGLLAAGTPIADPPAMTVDALRAYAAERRWAVETGGCAWNGHTVATDRDSQAKLIAEFVALGAGLRTDGAKWKMANGAYLPLTNAEAALMIGATRAHVTAAFATEATVLAAIAAGTITTIAGIDAAAWPAA